MGNEVQVGPNNPLYGFAATRSGFGEQRCTDTVNLAINTKGFAKVDGDGGRFPDGNAVVDNDGYEAIGVHFGQEFVSFGFTLGNLHMDCFSQWLALAMFQLIKD